MQALQQEMDGTSEQVHDDALDDAARAAAKLELQQLDAKYKAEIRRHDEADQPHPKGLTSHKIATAVGRSDQDVDVGRKLKNRLLPAMRSRNQIRNEGKFWSITEEGKAHLQQQEQQPRHLSASGRG